MGINTKVYLDLNLLTQFPYYAWYKLCFAEKKQVTFGHNQCGGPLSYKITYASSQITYSELLTGFLGGVIRYNMNGYLSLWRPRGGGGGVLYKLNF